MSEIKNVGLTITLIRHQKNITTDELAERCGFTTTMMEQIEQNETIPSLGHLIKVARALGVRLGTFLDDMDQLGPVVTRSGEIKRGTSFSNKNSNARLNLDFFPLASDKSGRHMEPFIVDIYVLNGKIEIKYGKEVYSLSEGDSIYYDSVVDHHVHAADESPAKILAVVYAPF